MAALTHECSVFNHTQAQYAKFTLLESVRNRWSIEGCFFIRETQQHEGAHNYHGNGACSVATLRTAAFNLLPNSCLNFEFALNMDRC